MPGLAAWRYAAPARREYFALRASAALASLGACRCVRPDAPTSEARPAKPGPEPRFYGSYGHGAVCACMARPVTEPGAASIALARPSRSGPEPYMRLWLVPSPGPGAAQTALARPDSGPGPEP